MIYVWLLLIIMVTAGPVSAQPPPGIAATGNEEPLCRNDTNVFMCENWQDYPAAFVGGNLGKHFKQGNASNPVSWVPDVGAYTIVDAIGPTGSQQHILEVHYSPTVQGATDGGAGAIGATLPVFQSEYYVRFYAKFVSYVWSPISTKHGRVIGDGGINETFLFTGHESNLGIPPINTQRPILQHSGGNTQNYDQNIGSTRFGPSVAGFSNNPWYCLEAHVRYNTAGNSDGVLEMWVDSVQRASYTGVLFASTQLSANFFGLATTWNCTNTSGGGGTCSPNTLVADVHGNMWRYTANIIMSTARIGCFTGTPAPGTPSNLTVTMNWLRRLWAWLAVGPVYAGSR